MLLQDEIRDLDTSTGKMRTYVYRPVAKGRYPGLIFYSEIFQQTGPIKRMAAFLAGHGFVVAVPEIFHELNPIGTVLAYDQAGADKGNADKITKSIAAYDEDTRVLIQNLQADPHCTGKLGAIGICIGGHLAYRAALRPEIHATACFYATDLHKHTLGAGMKDDSLDRIGEIKGEMSMTWGKQDPHIPAEGRAAIYQAMTDAEINFTWHEYNAQHAFMRDEGHRFDPALTVQCQAHLIELFKRKLSEGDLASEKPTGPCPC